jgi:hypothetical protein
VQQRNQTPEEVAADPSFAQPSWKLHDPQRSGVLGSIRHPFAEGRWSVSSQAKCSTHLSRFHAQLEHTTLCNPVASAVVGPGEKQRPFHLVLNLAGDYHISKPTLLQLTAPRIGCSPLPGQSRGYS